MMASKQLPCLVCTLILMMFTGCGYLDEDIWLTDEEFEEGFDEVYVEGMSIRGSSSSGYGISCGSMSYMRFGSHPIIVATAASAQEKTTLELVEGEEFEGNGVDATEPSQTAHLAGLLEDDDDEARHEASWGSVFVDMSTRRSTATRKFVGR